MKHWKDCTIKEKIERWEQVRRVLRALSPHARRKHWDMSTFGTQTECGTVACAAGHCGLDPWFRRRGFKLDFNGWQSHITFVPGFFGSYGSDRIFYNETIRPVSKVIREVEAFINVLKTKGDPEDSPDPEINYMPQDSNLSGEQDGYW